MSTLIHRDALGAWRALAKAGGIELDGRDEGLDDELRQKLDADAPDLETALRASSTDAFIRAFLKLGLCYVEMFRAILRYFEKAGAREGRGQWRIAVGDEHLELKHFEEFLSAWPRFAANIDAPAVDANGLRAVLEAARGLDPPPALGPLTMEEANETDPEINDWLRRYWRGEFPALPSLVDPEAAPRSVRDAHAVISVASALIRENFCDRDTMNRTRFQRSAEFDFRDGFNPITLGAAESDYFLGASLVMLLRYRELTPANQRKFEDGLEAAFAGLPRRSFKAVTDVSELERILSLPVWKRRHDLYPVWIATEIVAALGEHECTLHANDGKLTFTRRNTLLASVTSAEPVVRIWGERQSPLHAPLGKSRIENAQPDFSLWRDEAGQDTCGLVIEVKHYAQDARAKFREALVDYANAHKGADIWLLGHGPVANPLFPEDAPLAARCRTIAKYRADNSAARRQFGEIVRGYVGSAITRIMGDERAAIAALDVSQSMSPLLADSDFRIAVDSLRHQGCGEIAFVDSALRQLVSFERLADALARTDLGDSGDLDLVVDRLLERYRTLILVTDAEGLSHILGGAIGARVTRRFSGVDAHFLKLQSP